MKQDKLGSDSDNESSISEINEEKDEEISGSDSSNDNQSEQDQNESSESDNDDLQEAALAPNSDVKDIPQTLSEHVNPHLPKLFKRNRCMLRYLLKALYHKFIFKQVEQYQHKNRLKRYFWAINPLRTNTMPKSLQKAFETVKESPLTTSASKAKASESSILGKNTTPAKSEVINYYVLVSY